jgi:hypothetical protein
MIIFMRAIKWKLLKQEMIMQVNASVNIKSEVYLQIGDEQGVLLNPTEALALGEAIVRAAKGEGVPGS